MKALFTLLIFIAAVFAAQAQNTWTQKANFPSTPRAYVNAFSVGNTGFAFGGWQPGIATAFNDLWAFEPTTDTWTQKASLPAATRSQAGVFVIGTSAFIIGGRTESMTAIDNCGNTTR